MNYNSLNPTDILGKIIEIYPELLDIDKSYLNGNRIDNIYYKDISIYTGGLSFNYSESYCSVTNSNQFSVHIFASDDYSNIITTPIMLLTFSGNNNQKNTGILSLPFYNLNIKSCIDLYNMGIDIECFKNGSIVKYDKEMIMRRHAIECIINE